MAYPPSDVTVYAGQPVYLLPAKIEQYMPPLPSTPEPFPPSGNFMPLPQLFLDQMTAAVAASASQMGQDESEAAPQRNFVCQLCLPNCSFSKRIAYTNHVIVSHPDQKRIFCWIKGCNISRKSSDAIARHYIGDHLNPKLKPICIRCNEVFTTLNALNRHMPQHFLNERDEIREGAVGRIHYYLTSCVLVETDADGKRYFDRKRGAEIRLILHK